MGADVSAETSTGNGPLLHPLEKGTGALRALEHPAITHRLALAVIAFIRAPILLLDGDLTAIAANISFCDAFGIDPAIVQGRPLSQLGMGEWNTPQLSSLLRITASGLAEVKSYEMELRPAGQPIQLLSLDVQRIEDAYQGEVRLLLTASDVTAARNAERLKDDLLREKAVMLQELQHRIANSLQIVANLLLKSARKAQLDETRRYLHDAHHRIMSVAALQQKLAVSMLGNAELGPYLTALCESIGASMICDHARLSLEVNADQGSTSVDVSMSLGLVVTELVINALKHAFPDSRAGRIIVNYRARASDWVLSVSDNGIGMPPASESTTPGLGTGIVRALAQQLHARIEITDANPGTTISIIGVPEASFADVPIRQPQTLTASQSAYRCLPHRNAVSSPPNPTGEVRGKHQR